MRYALQWLRSLIFEINLYLSMLVLGIVFLPWTLFSARGAFLACKSYCRWIRWSAAWMVGLRSEVRGTPPTGEVMVAAKHQSFFDILMIFDAVPAAKFIMKKEILYTPIIGQYAYRIGCVPVSRGKRGAAIKKMVADVAAGLTNPGQLVIYPQGTRVAPGADVPYKVGTAVLYTDLDQDVVPVATNAGVFWPRRGIYRKPGLAVVDFLPAIPKGLERRAFMQQLEETIETRSDALMAEARQGRPDAKD